ncbi:MAG: Rrf2 family transcriptional regulator [Verrucomicrobiaceae bacterium]|nr:MAG: Rrf2 family transcriptional regulator [Verrucomicrobiaceae bacterium]
MKLSLFSDYSLRVLMYGALKGAPFQLDEVTDAYAISRHHLGKVVNRLARLGYLDTQRGRGGGIRLSLDPASIRIGQLLRKTEDQPVFVECFDPKTNRCPVAGSCRLKGFLAEAILEFYRSLDRHSLKDLVEGSHLEAMREALLGRTPAPAAWEVHPGKSPSP